MYKKSLAICKSALLLFLGIATMLIVYSCHDDDDDDDITLPPTPVEIDQTIFMYMPHSGLYSYLLKNIKDMEKAIVENKGLGGRKLIIFISENTTKARLIQIRHSYTKEKRDTCLRDTLKTYNFNTPEFVKAEGITSILNDVKHYAPSSNYGMIIGSHGLGWLPAGLDPRQASYANAQKHQSVKKYGANAPLTRFFGVGMSGSQDFQTEISSLANGIINAGIKMDYIVFDVCYMSNIETAYELRNATKYFIASTCEVLIDGIPYAEVGKGIMKMDFKAVCDGYYEHYSKFSPPCATIAVIDCEEIERMAEIMKEVNSMYDFDSSETNELQTLDGFPSTVFFDFDDYVAHLCKDEALYNKFSTQMSLLVPYKRNTDTYYYYLSLSLNGEKEIKTFSGLTISEPTQNNIVTPYIKDTSWYKDTH